MIPAHRFCFQTRCVWPSPDQATQIGSGSVSHNMIHAFFEKTELNRVREVGSGRYDPGRFWLHAGRNGHNWPLPKRFRIESSPFARGRTWVYGVHTLGNLAPHALSPTAFAGFIHAAGTERKASCPTCNACIIGAASVPLLPVSCPGL